MTFRSEGQDATSVRDDWFVTAHGRRVFVQDPDPKQIFLDDIAHALANLCRFGGHTKTFYSVAQHSILVSELVSPKHALAGLLHDAAEAYLGDVIRPLKRQLGPYREIEARWEFAIALRFHVPRLMPRAVKVADITALVTERRDLCPTAFTQRPWVEDEAAVQPAHVRIVPMSPREAETTFLTKYEEIRKESDEEG